MSILLHLKLLKKMGLESKIIDSAADKIKIGRLELLKVRDDLVRIMASELSKKGNNMHQGILFKHSSQQIRRWLEKNEISYVTEDGYACLFTKDQTYIFRPAIKIEKSDSNHQNIEPPKSTSIINPSSLKLIDAAIKMPAKQFRNLTGTELAAKLKIPQSSLSKIFSASKVKNALEYREFVLSKTVDYWLNLMAEPKLSRYLTPFFQVSNLYRFPERELNSREANDWLEESIIKYKDKVLPGPLELAKVAGGLNDSLVTLWCSPNILAEFKKQNRLVPCIGRDRPMCAIGVPKRTFEKESIISDLDSEIDFAFPSWIQGQNIIRAIWDLGFADSRARETRSVIFQRLLNEIR